MKNINVKLIHFKESVTMACDTHPVANDSDYCEVVTTKPKVKYEYDGISCSMYGKTPEDTLNDILPRIKKTVAFEQWFEDNLSSTFEDIGMKPPVVYDYEDDDWYSVKRISSFVNNCCNSDNYEKVISALKEHAEKEYNIIIKVVE